MTVVSIVGMAGAGKSEVARVFEEAGYSRIRFGDITEEEIKNYIFKQKIRHKKFAIWEFLSRKRTQKILVLTGIVFLVIVLFGIYLHDKNRKVIWEEGNKTLSSDVEVIE